MIRVDRSLVPEPASLSALKYGPASNQTERDAVLDEITSHVGAGRSLDSFRYSVKFKAYTKNDVKQALRILFKGKCAYCESSYANTQPMDVEHWRPKAVVKERNSAGKLVSILGYPWLASTWENLLPSCIDCNRERKQTDASTNTSETQGKANQFPVDGPRWHPPVRKIRSTVVDRPLILNPTVDTPAEHLDFGSDGTVVPRDGSRKGSESIRVYALNRTDLAFERLGLARLIEQRLTTIEKLAILRDEPLLPVELRLNVDDLIAHEINALYQMAEPDRPYSEMARQVIAMHAPI